MLVKRTVGKSSECMNCGHIVMMTRREFEKKMKKVLEKNVEKE